MGGAFNPAISTLDLNDVERIEVLKGSAPVMYGATSFVGAVQILHYPAGQAAQQIDLEGGNPTVLRAATSPWSCQVQTISAIHWRWTARASALRTSARAWPTASFYIVPPTTSTRVRCDLIPISPSCTTSRRVRSCA